MTKTAERYVYAPPEGEGVEMSPAEMEPYIARYADLKEDLDIFPGIKATPDGYRKHFHVISHNSHLGPASITTPHGFHMSFLEVPPGNGGKLHAHNLPEVFIGVTGLFEISWGNQGHHSVVLGPRDTISVPPRHAYLKNCGEGPGILQVIYDGAGEVLGGIFRTEEKLTEARREHRQGGAR